MSFKARTRGRPRRAAAQLGDVGHNTKSFIGASSDHSTKTLPTTSVSVSVPRKSQLKLKRKPTKQAVTGTGTATKPTLSQTKPSSKQNSNRRETGEGSVRFPKHSNFFQVSQDHNQHEEQLSTNNMTLGEKEKGPVSKLMSGMWSKDIEKDVAGIDLTLQAHVNSSTKKNEQSSILHKWKKFHEVVTGTDYKNGEPTGTPLPKYLEKKEYYDQLFVTARGKGANKKQNKRKEAKENLIQDFNETWDQCNEDKRKNQGREKDNMLKDTPMPIKKAYGKGEGGKKLPPKNGMDTITGGDCDYPSYFCFPYAERVPNKESSATTRTNWNRLRDGDHGALEYNIQPLDPDIPHQIGFQIHLLPKLDLFSLVVSQGNKQAMKTFAKEAHAINLCMDELQINMYLLGNLSKDKKSLTKPSSEEKLLEKIASLSQFGKTKLEICVSDALGIIEKELKTVGIGQTTRMDQWESWDDIPETWQKWFLSRAEFIAMIGAPPCSNQDLNKHAEKPRGTRLSSWKKALEGATEAEKRSKDQALKNRHFISLLGDIPPCEKSTRSFYLMDQWGCEGLKESKSRKGAGQKQMSLYEVEKTGETVYHSKYMGPSQGVSVGNIHSIVAKTLQKVLQLDGPFEYTGGSGIVKTGHIVPEDEVESLLPECIQCSGQENHVDCLNALKSELLAKFYKGELEEEDASELLSHGYLIDIPLTETGRVTKILVPGKKGTKELVQKTIYTPFGSATVRNMILLHGGHGGECGNTLWHGSIFPKGVLEQVDEDKLGYVRLLPEYHKEFKDYKLVWKEGTPNLPQNWLKKVNALEKKMSVRYASGLYRNYKDNDSQMWITRWLLGPNEKNLKLTNMVVKQMMTKSHKENSEETDDEEGNNAGSKKRTETPNKKMELVTPKKLKMTYWNDGYVKPTNNFAVDVTDANAAADKTTGDAASTSASNSSPANSTPGQLENKNFMEADI